MDYDQINAKMMAESRQGIGGAIVGGRAGNAFPEPTPLAAFRQRILECSERAASTAAILQDHADRVFHPQPESDAKALTRPCRSGQIGEVQDALDVLEDAISRVQDQAARNCKPA